MRNSSSSLILSLLLSMLLLGSSLASSSHWHDVNEGNVHSLECPSCSSFKVDNAALPAPAHGPARDLTATDFPQPRLYLAAATPFLGPLTRAPPHS